MRHTNYPKPSQLNYISQPVFYWRENLRNTSTSAEIAVTKLKAGADAGEGEFSEAGFFEVG